MKTLENQNKVGNTDNKVQTNVTARPSIPNPSKENKEVGKEEQKPQSEAKKADAPISAKPEVSKTEQKSETKQEIKSKNLALNLEGTLKLVEELHRRKVQRDRLLETIDTLEAFEVAQKENAEETGSNHFQGCVLTIADDKNREFTTKNPVIIFSVAQYVNSMCVNRLAEIEAEITIPS